MVWHPVFHYHFLVFYYICLFMHYCWMTLIDFSVVPVSKSSLLRNEQGSTSCDRMAFSACVMDCHGKYSEFHFSALRHHLHRYPAVLSRDTQQIKVCDCQVRWIRWMWHLSHFKRVMFSNTMLSVWHRELSQYDRKLLRAISADFVECSRFNGWMISISRQWRIVQWNYPLVVEDPE
jgi:hypothetical protein